MLLEGKSPYYPDEEVDDSRRESTLRLMKDLTGQDFGYDIEAWREFLIDHPFISEERAARGELPEHLRLDDDPSSLYAFPGQSIWTELLLSLDGCHCLPGGMPNELSEEELEKWRTVALDNLKYLTGQDFGYDTQSWRAWLRAHPNIIDERTARGELPSEETFVL